MEENARRVVTTMTREEVNKERKCWEVIIDQNIKDYGHEMRRIDKYLTKQKAHCHRNSDSTGHIKTTTISVWFPWRTWTTTYSDKNWATVRSVWEVTRPEITQKYFTNKGPALIGSFHIKSCKVTGNAKPLVPHEGCLCNDAWGPKTPMVTPEEYQPSIRNIVEHWTELAAMQ